MGYLAYGEGWHNYHHVFPWDYKAAELGNYNGNFTTGFIDLFAKLGKEKIDITFEIFVINRWCVQ